MTDTQKVIIGLLKDLKENKKVSIEFVSNGRTGNCKDPKTESRRFGSSVEITLCERDSEEDWFSELNKAYYILDEIKAERDHELNSPSFSRVVNTILYF